MPKTDAAAFTAAALVAALAALVAAVSGQPAWHIATAALMAGALPLFRRVPEVAAAATVAGAACSALQSDLPLGLLPILMADLYLAGRHTAVSVAIATGVAAVCLMETHAGSDGAVPYVLTLATPAFAGQALRSRALIADELALRASEPDGEREMFADLAVRYERARIASELHDIVGHAIAVMVVQATAGQRLASRDLDGARAAFRTIGDAARQAEADVTRLVELLSDDDALMAPPDLGLVQELVDRAAATGLEVTLSPQGDREWLSPAASRVAFLVVREALTNALRHGPGAPVQIRLALDRETLEVEVVNGPAQRPVGSAQAGAGTGLRGLRERLDEHGGQLEAHERADGGFGVRARVPARA